MGTDIAFSLQGYAANPRLEAAMVERITRIGAVCFLILGMNSCADYLPGDNQPPDQEQIFQLTISGRFAPPF